MRLTGSTYGRGLALGALALAIAGCQNLRGPDPASSVAIPTLYQNLPDGYAGANGPTIASLGWQEFFSDSRLHQLITLGLANNRDLRTTVLNIERARQQYRISDNALLPTVNASASATRQETTQAPDPYTTYSVGLGVTAYELDFFGRVRNLRDAALDTSVSYTHLTLPTNREV